MSIVSFLVVMTFAQFVGVLVCLELGGRLAARFRRRHDGEQVPGSAALEGAVFALMGLLVAFTFSGAASRFEARRQLILEEANAIGTAYLRLDLLPPASQPKLRADFREYVGARVAAFRALPDVAAHRSELERATRLQGVVWSDAVEAVRGAEGPSATMLLLPALNAMIDVTTARLVATETHPPRIVFFMLVGLTLASALLAGYGMAPKRRSLLHSVLFAAVTTMSLYVILDLEYPRFGLIRIDVADRVLEDVLRSMQ